MDAISVCSVTADEQCSRHTCWSSIDAFKHPLSLQKKSLQSLKKQQQILNKI